MRKSYRSLQILTLAYAFLTLAPALGAGMDEVNYWRSRNRLPVLIEDPALTEFAQMKANYRAQRMLKDGHQGPRWPQGTTEGTGEATAAWGWLTCIMEGEGKYAGAGVAIGPDGERYMVLVIRGPARSLINPHRIRTLPTAHLTPNPPRFR